MTSGKKRGAWAEIFASRRMAIVAALGLASGLPLLLTGQVMALWLTDAHIDIKTIALFASVGLPYTFKFAWAGVLDVVVPPVLGRRRGWILITQIGLVAAIVVLASADPASSTGFVAVMAIVVAALSATQDVVIDAWRAEILAPEERAAGSAVYVLGYRVGMLAVGTAGLILADFTSYRVVFLGTAGLLALCMVATFLAEEPTQTRARPRGITEAVLFTVVDPIVEFFKRLGGAALVALAFAALYKFGDQMVDGLIGPFWRRELELSKTEIGTITKFAGFTGVAVGGFLAGILTPRLGSRRALLLFGVLQAATNFLYVALTITGKSYPLIVGAIFVDYVANTMGTAVFMAVFIAMCNKQFTAMQYALLTSLSSVGKRIFGWVGGDIIADAGWAAFFCSTAAMAIPGIILVLFLSPSLLEPPRKPGEAPAETSASG
jgi:MFS transporter, PAT family, beta-lactamase induction signal transducer AmpG